jgi:hypothetical protein
MPSVITPDPQAMAMAYALIGATQDLADQELDWLFEANEGTALMFEEKGRPNMGLVQRAMCAVLASETMRRRRLLAEATEGMSAPEDPQES